ncbi:hypothetical protein FNV43_RR12501 [Rhamnella rubrinervis]|uniref:Uncharacterized protein n=1 Tax=Rhamnella rubrinervis TaxID=2594499 RepID=A0A8K0H7F6_9ROSA|nr:hypothetical protein FNV43_RR12501 [Rhamnella rubrinervis]
MPTMLIVLGADVDQDDKGIANEEMINSPSDGSDAILVVLINGHRCGVDGWKGIVGLELRGHENRRVITALMPSAAASTATANSSALPSTTTTASCCYYLVKDELEGTRFGIP